MADLTIIGAGITGLLISELFKGKSEIYDKENNISKLNSSASLWTIIPPLCGNYTEHCKNSINFYQTIGTRYKIFYKKTYTLTDQQSYGKELSEKELAEIEPNITLDSKMRLIEDSLFIEGDELLQKLVSNNNVSLGKKVISIEVENEEAKYIKFENGERKKVERLVLANGVWINDLYHLNLQPFKGHLIITKSSFVLNGIIHYKGKIFVKGKENLYINGDSRIDFTHQINYNSVKENIEIVSKIFNFDKNIKIRVGFRSVSENGNPIIKKIYKNVIAVSGFRFGFALAPFMAEEVIKLLNGM